MSSTSFRLTSRPRGTSQSADGEEPSGHLSGCAIALIVIGVAAAVMMTIGICYLIYHRRKKSGRKEAAQLEPESGCVKFPSPSHLPSPSPPQPQQSTSTTTSDSGEKFLSETERFLRFWRAETGDDELSFESAAEMEGKLIRKEIQLPLPKPKPKSQWVHRSPTTVLRFWRAETEDDELSFEAAAELESKLARKVIQLPLPKPKPLPPLSRSPTAVWQFWRLVTGDYDLSLEKAVELETKSYRANEALGFPKEGVQPMEKPAGTDEPPQLPVKLPNIVAPPSPTMKPTSKKPSPTPVHPKESPKKPAGPDDKVGKIVVTKLF